MCISLQYNLSLSIDSYDTLLSVNAIRVIECVSDNSRI